MKINFSARWFFLGLCSLLIIPAGMATFGLLLEGRDYGVLILLAWLLITIGIIVYIAKSRGKLAMHSFILGYLGLPFLLGGAVQIYAKTKEALIFRALPEQPFSSPAWKSAHCNGGRADMFKDFVRNTDVKGMPTEKLTELLGVHDYYNYDEIVAYCLRGNEQSYSNGQLWVTFSIDSSRKTITGYSLNW